MFLPQLADCIQVQARSDATRSAPLDGAHFALNSMGVAGLFGGDEAVLIVALAQIDRKGKWLGWYNSPGSYVMGRRICQLARAGPFGIMPKVDGRPAPVQTDPAVLLEDKGWPKGPRFRGFHSRTDISETGPLSTLLMKKTTQERGVWVENPRMTQPVAVTVAQLQRSSDRFHEQESVINFDLLEPFWAIVPIVISLGTCALCGLYRDWYSFCMILLGILARGLSCVVIGSGELVLSHPKPAKGCPPGDGILGCDKELILLKGEESIINTITRATFTLRFASEDAFRRAEWCAYLLIAQAIIQLILIPQGSFFGQLMFVISLAFSWVYNLWLSCFEKQTVHLDMLMKEGMGQLSLTKFIFTTRATAVVFALLVLGSSDYQKLNSDNAEESFTESSRKIMDAYLPPDTKVWRAWKKIIIDQLKSRGDSNFNNPDSHSYPDFSQSDTSFLEDLQDAGVAWDSFRQYQKQVTGQQICQINGNHTQ
ncbi:hypothetical protein ID866_5112 [Astraeus odoratus]|nr:hypothetical protein ID866_5112 [Astraeus odoratus]